MIYYRRGAGCAGFLFWRGIDFNSGVGYANDTVADGFARRFLGVIMQWTAPAFEEICLNCEINSYASAKL
jgi:coenzyme PQQ precursor peptide PqqA